MLLKEELLFTGLGMPGQGAVYEASPPWFVDQIDHTARES